MLSGSRPISALCIHLHPYLVSAAHCISYLLTIHCYPYIAAPCMAMALRHAPLLCNVYSHHTFHPNRLMSLWMWGVALSVYPHDPRSMDPGSMQTSSVSYMHYVLLAIIDHAALRLCICHGLTTRPLRCTPYDVLHSTDLLGSVLSIPGTASLVMS